MVGTMVATFSRCAVVIHWLPHTPVQILFHLVFELKKVWCYLSSLNIQTRVLAQTFRITLMCRFKPKIVSIETICSAILLATRLYR